MIALMKRYPKKVDKQKRKEYTLEFGKEAYVSKQPKVAIEMHKIEKINKKLDIN